MKKIKKWQIVTFVILSIGGYWLTQNNWIFEHNVPQENYKEILTEAKEWKEIKSTYNIFAVTNNIIETVHKSLLQIIRPNMHYDIPNLPSEEIISFRTNNTFLKQGNTSPAVDGVWELEGNYLFVTDDNIRDLWGGEKWFDTEKKIIKLNRNILVIYHNGVYVLYKANQNKKS